MVRIRGDPFLSPLCEGLIRRAARRARLERAADRGPTTNERRIAAAAAGRSNRDIAQALYVNLETVEHLTAAYRRLGVSARAELWRHSQEVGTAPQPRRSRRRDAARHVQEPPASPPARPARTGAARNFRAIGSHVAPASASETQQRALRCWFPWRQRRERPYHPSVAAVTAAVGAASSVRTAFLTPSTLRGAGSWQHPWQHPDRPMRPYRPHFGTIRTIWCDSDGYDTRVTRLRAWSRITGWRFESSSAHRKALHSGAFRVLGKRLGPRASRWQHIWQHSAAVIRALAATAGTTTRQIRLWRIRIRLCGAV